VSKITDFLRWLSSGLLIALMMEAGSTSETSVDFYQTTRRINPEDSSLPTCRRENLKSHKTDFCFSNSEQQGQYANLIL
jgi:hypothetical protein